MARVLVLNDDQTMLDLYEDALKELGHEPVAKHIVESGPQTVEEVAADALLVDLQRPDEEHYGLRIIEEIRAETRLRAFPIVLCTGAVEELRSVLPVLESLGVPVLRKPFEITELRSTLEAVMGEAAPNA
jgi:DNA-binding response OmpR family regulator